MDKALLRHSRLKLGRAGELHDELRTFTDTTFADDAHRPRVAIERLADPGQYALRIVTVPEVGDFLDRVGLLLGDAIHNLRSALDHMVFQLAAANLGSPPGEKARTQFPICDDDKKFKEDAKSMLKDVREDDRLRIESFQPYHRWNVPPNTQYSDQLGGHFHPIHKLRELSNLDKHRESFVLVPYQGALEMRNAQHAIFKILDAAVRQGQLFRHDAIRLDARIARATVLDMEECETGEPAFLLVEAALDDGRPVRPVLDRIIKAVDAVVETFEAAP
ncbi:MAG: hypothetical protein HYY95_03910 [Candidatus Rokubacteria bacterium]|nr:hypothetical protein [Candidatus Rokubacteria bacterium]